MGISAEIVTRIGDVQGIILPDGSMLPFGTAIKEVWVIHPEETRSGTCEECAALAGEVFEAGEGDMPPVHANCVCERVPIMDTIDPDTGDVINGIMEAGIKSITMAEMGSMADEALQALIDNETMDEKTIVRARVILKRRKGKS
jgi:hypothetical protein